MQTPQLPTANVNCQPATNMSSEGWHPANASYRQRRFENKPLKIEDYEPGKSSIARQQTNPGRFHNPPIDKPGDHCKYIDNPNIKYRIRKNTGSTSPHLTDSLLHEQYRRVQRGGDIPFTGLRCPTPPKAVGKTPTSSDDELARLSQLDSDYHSLTASLSGTINSRRVRDEINLARKIELELVLAEERRKRLEQEEKINRSRRHSAFILRPTGPVCLDRYNDDDSNNMSAVPRHYCSVRGKARAIYNFQAQNTRELTLRKGDIVYLTRVVDDNWFEGEHHGLVGRFPVSYVQVLVTIDEANTLNRQKNLFARAMHDFYPQHPFELPLQKGDVATVLRRVDENWYEGRMSGQRGLFPVSYVQLMTTPPPSTDLSPETVDASIPPRSDVSGAVKRRHRSADRSARSTSAASRRRSIDELAVESRCVDQVDRADADIDQLSSNAEKSAIELRQTAAPDDDSVTSSYSSEVSQQQQQQQQQSQQPVTVVDVACPASRATGACAVRRRDRRAARVDSHRASAVDPLVTSSLAVDGDVTKISTSERGAGISYTPYYAVSDYSAQNSDQLSVMSGDTIYVTEMFDDGWFVGISQRTNDLGSFPGTCVRKLRVQ